MHYSIEFLIKQESPLFLKRLIIAGAFALAGFAASGTQAHAKLESSEPRASSTLDAAPKQIRLHFNEPLEAAFSKLKLTAANDGEIALPRVDVDKATMVAPVPALPRGEYRVQWSAMTHDGHKVKGEFTFRVK
jgi:methionine-rich copper-binding protein CopC